MTMLLRRKAALAVASLAIAAPALSSCGFNYATDRPNVIANGGYALEGDIHVLAARVVAPAPGSGAFVATITNLPNKKPVTLDSITADGVHVAAFHPIKVATGAAVNLADGNGIGVTGDFEAGDVIPFTLGFSDGSSVTIGAIAVTRCHEYQDATPAAGEPHSSATPYSCDYPSLPAAAE